MRAASEFILGDQQRHHGPARRSRTTSSAPAAELAHVSPHRHRWASSPRRSHTRSTSRSPRSSPMARRGCAGWAGRLPNWGRRRNRSRPWSATPSGPATSSAACALCRARPSRVHAAGGSGDACGRDPAARRAGAAQQRHPAFEPFFPLVCRRSTAIASSLQQVLLNLLVNAIQAMATVPPERNGRFPSAQSIRLAASRGGGHR